MRAGLSLPEKWFLALAIPLGLGLMLAIPPFQIEDEFGHFWHAYALSQMHVLPQPNPSGSGVGAPLPESAVALVYMKPHHGIGGNPGIRMRLADLWGLRKLPLEPEKRAFADYSGVAFYAPPPYLAPAFAIGLGHLAGLPPIVLFYLGRAAGFAAWLALMFAAIRATPIFRWGLMLLALLPLTISQAVGITADSFLCGIAYLTMAWCLRLALAPEERATRRDLGILLALCVLLALAKQAYFLIALLFFLIPPARLGSRRRYLGFTALLFGSVFAVLAVWGALTTPLMRGWMSWVDPGAQMRHVLSHPLGFAWIVLRTLKNEQSMAKLLGRIGWEDFQLPELLVWLPLVGILFATFGGQNEPAALGVRRRLLLGGTFVGSVFLMALLLYMAWNPVGNEAVRGMQRGRYYLPLAPLPFLALYGLRPRAGVWVPAVAIAASVWAFWIVCHRYIAF